MPQIVFKEEIAPDIFRMSIRSPLVSTQAQPGQFIILRVDEYSERIPLTIFKADKDKGEIEIIFQVVGLSTKKLSLLNTGQNILDLAGPLGRPTPVKFIGKILFVAGGVGLAELYPVASAFREVKNDISFILGARNKDYLILQEEVKKLSSKVYITTDDGSSGRKGFVTEVLVEVLEREEPQLIYTCGPTLMMKKVAEISKSKEVPCLASLNAIMLDGTGMCGSCRIKVDGKIRFCCVDGPDFDAWKVDFDSLLNRQRRFLSQEAKALEKLNPH